VLAKLHGVLINRHSRTNAKGSVEGSFTKPELVLKPCKYIQNRKLILSRYTFTHISRSFSTTKSLVQAVKTDPEKQTSAHLVLERDLLEVDSLSQRQLGGQEQLPDVDTEEVVGGVELHDERDPSMHGLVQIVRPVGRQEHDALVALHLG
jgi:hypothetical protein